MAPSKWDDEQEDSTPPSSPPQIARRGGKFDDEEAESDVAEEWDAATDSEDERKKAAAEAEKKKAEELAKATHKSKAQRRADHIAQRQKQLAEEEGSESEDEDDATKRARLRKQEIDADLRNAEDMFGDIGISKNRTAKPITVADAGDPSKTVELSSLSLFAPATRDQFVQLREALAPLIAQNSKKAHYPLFMVDFARALVKEMGSDQIKKVASALTTASNEKMKEEKAADKTGKKTKAAKSKTTLHASRDTVLKADTNAYEDDGLGDDDFM